MCKRFHHIEDHVDLVACMINYAFRLESVGRIDEARSIRYEVGIMDGQIQIAQNSRYLLGSLSGFLSNLFACLARSSSVEM